MRDDSEKQRKQFLGRQKKRYKNSIDKIAVKVLCRIDTAEHLFYNQKQGKTVLII